MVQNYADVIAKQKEIGTAKILNPNYDVQVRQEQFRIDQQNKLAREKAVNDFIDQKISDGFKRNPDGSLVKVVGDVTTTISNVRVEGSNVTADVQTVTVTKPEKKQTSQYDELNKKIRKYQNVLRDIDSGRTQASANARESIARQLKYLYEARDNLENTGSAFYTVPSEPVVNKSVEQQSGVVFDSKGLGYSVAPELQKDFLEKKEASYKQVQVDLPQRSSSSFTVPRTVSSQETQSVPLVVDLKNVAPIKTQTFGGTIQASRVGDFAIRYDQQGNRLTPTPTDLAEYKVNAFIPESTLKPIASGVVAGLLAPARLGETLFMASNFNPNELNQQATQSRIKQGVVEVVKDPFTKLVAEPIQTVVENPLYEAPKLATEIFLLEGASRGTKAIVKEVGAVNRYSGADVRASAYDLSRSSERASVFLKENQISPNTVGSPEFVPVRQLTVDISPFNKNQKYFSNPELDVGVDRQFTLAGTEVKPPVNKKGILPLDEVEVTPFESNRITIEQIGKKPLIDATSTAQSRVVDLPVAKSFNKDTLQGTPIIDLQNPERSSFISQDLKQTTLAPIENKVSSVPKGSQKPLIYEKVKPVENKPVIDNSFAFESGGSVVVTESGSAPVSIPARSFGSEKRLKVNAEYVYDSGSGEYVRKVGDFELNLDIKGKVTPSNFGVQGAFVGALPKTDQPTQIIPKIQVDQIQSPKIVPDVKSGSDLKIDIVSDQGQKPRTKIVQLQSPVQLTDQVNVQEQQSKLSLSLKQDQVQRVKPQLLSPRVEKSEIIKPLLPTLRTERQVKSGSGLFDVLVRKEGKFVKIGSGYSDLATAFNRGRQEVKGTARASFKVVSRLGEPQRFNIGSDRSLTRSKRDPNVIVQKREFRISSEGEKSEISRKGVFVQRARRGLNKLNKGIFNK